MSSSKPSPSPSSSFALEQLEDRRLMSVTATVLAGPLLTGTTWTYKVTAGSTTSTVTNKVVGAAKVGKINTVEIDNSSKIGATSTSGQSFVHLDTRTGLVTYKISAKTTGTGFTSSQVHLPSPYNTIFPATMVAKTTYTFKWTDKVTTTATVIGTTTATDSIIYTVRLSSDKTTKVTVPAGTFNCYTVSTTIKTTESGHTTTASATEYIAANVGLVKTIAGGSTTVLTKFVKGK